MRLALIDGEPEGEMEDVGVGILVHLKDNRFVGVDQGGCSLIGTYHAMPDGRTSFRLAYAFKGGTELANGHVFEKPTTIESDLILDPGAAGWCAAAGRHRPRTGAAPAGVAGRTGLSRAHCRRVRPSATLDRQSPLADKGRQFGRRFERGPIFRLID